MKKLFCLLAVVGVLFTACEPDSGIDSGDPDNNGNQTEQPGGGNQGGNDTPDDAYITLNKEIVNFSPDGESVDIKVYSNYKWTLTNNCDWITTSATSGEASEDGSTITLTAELSYDDHEGTIIFSCGKAKKVLVVSQSLKETIIADENNTFNVSVDGGTVELAYQTSVECEVIIPEEAQSWISLASDATKGLVSEVATLNVAKNNTGAQRSAVVKVVKKDDSSLSVEYTITQERNMDYVILYTTTDGKLLSPNYFTFEYISNTYEDGVGMLAFDGSKVSSIGDRAFKDCYWLKSITIPDGVTSIGYGAFGLCTSLTSITIPDSVTEIGEHAFNGCESLISVTIPDSVTEIKLSTFVNCESLTNVVIPNSVTSIGDLAFYLCTSLTSITIPDSVTSIGDEAFNDCISLTSITIPDSVTSIGDGTFYQCTSLTSVTIGDSVTSIGDYAFYECTSLTSIVIPDSVTSIGDTAFCRCRSLTSVTIGDSVTSIGESAFYECTSLTSVTIGNSVTSIGDEAFYYCSSLTSVTIPDGVTSIGGSTFCSCRSLTSVIIGDSVTSIGEGAFQYCESLTSVTIPDSVTSIGDDAFYYCKSLTNITIPDGVTEIGDYAFCCCTSLKEVYCKPITPPSGGLYMFSVNASGRKIYVPRNSVDDYKSTYGWDSDELYIVGYDF